MPAVFEVGADHGLSPRSELFRDAEEVVSIQTAKDPSGFTTAGPFRAVHILTSRCVRLVLPTFQLDPG